VITAFVLITAETGRAKEVARRIRGLDGVRSAYAVTGHYDVIAQVEAEDIPTLGTFVIERIQTLPGVTRTITLLGVETPEELHRKEITV
jgi:DNA-binding Lrp family transcriptional regulator